MAVWCSPCAHSGVPKEIRTFYSNGSAVCPAGPLRPARLPARRGAVPFLPRDSQSRAFVGAYKVSKAVLNRGTQLQSVAWRAQGVAVSTSVVCPGWVRTRMGGPAASRSIEEGAASVMLAAQKKKAPGLKGATSADLMEKLAKKKEMAAAEPRGPFRDY